MFSYELELICLRTVKRFQLLLFIICTQLKGFKYCFFHPLLSRKLPLIVLAFGVQVIFTNPCLITIDDSMKQVRLILKTLSDVLTRLLIVIQQFWYQCCVDFLHAQIFSDHFSNTIFFHVQMTCNHPNSQRTIATRHQPHPLDVNLIPAC